MLCHAGIFNREITETHENKTTAADIFSAGISAKLD
jgi:hypothetical protein